jgi:UDP-N-acetyl-D-galactosamine dehydrogenase
LQAVLLDKTHVTMMFSKFKKNELTNNQINGLYCSATLSDIADCNYIITVPTSVDNRPDLTPLYKSSETVGVLKKGDIVIYESTVYPGVTEEECVPVLKNIRIEIQ